MNRRLSVAALVGCALSCDLVQLGGPDTRTLEVQHHLAECRGEAIALCMLVRESGDEPFGAFFGAIEGFDYEWGYRYALEVEERPVDNPPADGLSIRTSLRTMMTREQVAAGTSFDLALTPGDGRVAEVAPGRYRFYRSAEFVCLTGAACAALRERISSGGRVALRLEHPERVGDPLVVVRWAPCDGEATSCTA